jgi:hypothetical protein
VKDQRGTGMGIVSEAEGINPEKLGVSGLEVLQRGQERKAMIIGEEKVGILQLTFFEYVYTTGPGSASSKDRDQKHKHTMCLVRGFVSPPPVMRCMPSDVSHRVGEESGLTDIDFRESVSFSQRYWVTGPDETAVRQFMRASMVQALASADALFIESGREGVLLYQMGRYPNRGALEPWAITMRSFAQAAQ